MLNGNIKILCRFRLGSDNIQQFVGNPFRITIEQTNPLEAINPAQTAEQFRQSGSSVQILAVTGGVLRDNDQLLDAVPRQRLRFFYNIFHPAAAERPADGRNGTVGAAVAASFRHL